MADVYRTVLIGQSADRMYRLVTDVARYPEFLPWCGSVDIFEQTETVLDAKINIHFKGIKQYFHTRNVNHRPETIDMVFVDGPFKHFSGHWNFIPLKEGACKVDFKLNWEFKSVILDKIIGPVFGHIASTFVDCFVKRAEDLYG
jgi:ribosome-associated toxin RatA of RatAB toxin-antitoxin module